MLISLDNAIARLKNGEVVAIPTETVYGLAADASNEAALRQIFSIKQRPIDNPLIVHIADSTQVFHWASEFSPLAQKLANAFWPGPLTLVLPANNTVSPIVRANQPTVALRVPAHPLALQLLQKSGLGLAAPSANQYTQLSPTCAQHVAAGLGDDIPVLDGGACTVGIESTIVAVQGGDWQLLRLGMISEAEIEKVANKQASQFAQIIKAPGQHHLHYAPRTPMRLFDSLNALIAHTNEHPNYAALLFNQPVLFDQAIPLNCPIFLLKDNAVDAAQQLYDILHQMDALGATELLIETPPSQPEWLAILDRLTRAAG